MYSIEYYNRPLHVVGDDELFLLNPALNVEANKSGTITGQILNTHPYFSELSPLKFGITVKKNGQLIMRGRIIKLTQTFNNTYDLRVEDKLAALNDSPCRPFSFEGTPEELFTWFIDNHNLQVSDEQKFLKGNVTVTDPNNYISRSWNKADNTWKLMNSRLIDTLGGYLVVRYEDDGDYLDWLADFDVFSQQKIEFGENLMDIEKIIDATETYTACIPYGTEIINTTYEEVSSEGLTWSANRYYLLVTGTEEQYALIETEEDFDLAISEGKTIYEIKSQEYTGTQLTIESVNDGKDYLINESLAGKYGIIYAPTDTVTWSDVTRPENLKIKASNWLNNDGVMLKESITFSAIDLAMAGIDIASFRMYDKVWAVSEPHGVNAAYLITAMKIAMDTSETQQITVGTSKKTLSSQTVDSKKENQEFTETIEEIKKDYATNEKVSSDIITASSQILQTAEQITIGILSGYTSQDDFEEYTRLIQSQLNATAEGFSFEFSQIESTLSALGGEIAERNQFIRLEEGNIVIGKSDSPITAIFTNDALEFLYNNQVVAKFTNEVLEVRNIAIENQLRFGSDWAIRPGDYVEGVGYNLNDVWIGG